MAAPTYDKDLQDINLAESVTGWAAFGGGASGLGVGADLSFQGNLAVDKAVSAADKGQYFLNGSGIVLGAGEHVFAWLANGTPGISQTLANKGASILVGTSGTAYCQYHVEGSDTYGAAGRIARCYPVDYSLRTGSTSAPAYRTVTGSPGADPAAFGGGLVITATAKGSNCAVDAIRRGTGMYVTAGEVASPGTFLGAAAANDDINARWGILTRVGPTFELQGKLVVGQNASKSATAAYWNDTTGATLLFLDTPHVAAGFNELKIDHASTVFNMTGGWTIKQETRYPSGGTRKGIVNFVAVASADLTGITMDGIGAVTLRSGVTAVNAAFKGTGQVTANGATLNGAVFSGFAGTADTSHLIWDTNDDTDGKLDGATFTKGSASAHALELGTTSPLAITLRDVAFVGYNGSNNQNDSAIHVKRTSGTVEITVLGGTTPSYRSDGATVTFPTIGAIMTFQANVSLVGAEVRIYDLDSTPPDFGTELAGTESHNAANYSYNGAVGNVIVLQVMKAGFEEFTQQFTVPTGDTTFDITLTPDSNA